MLGTCIEPFSFVTIEAMKTPSLSRMSIRIPAVNNTSTRFMRVCK